MQKISPFIWFDSEAEEAANFYVSLFKNSKITKVSRFGDDEDPESIAKIVEFELEGQEFMALNGGHQADHPGAPYHGAIALYVDCATQDEVDALWAKLTEGGKDLNCGWVTDKYGVTWNIVPAGLREYIGGPDPEKAQRAMQAMLQMGKLDINALRRAYEGSQ